MKRITFKYYTASKTCRYIDATDDMISRYNNNNIKHSPIETAPVMASKQENEKQVYMNLYGDEIHDTETQT